MVGRPVTRRLGKLPLGACEVEYSVGAFARESYDQPADYLCANLPVPSVTGAPLPADGADLRLRYAPVAAHSQEIDTEARRLRPRVVEPSAEKNLRPD